MRWIPESKEVKRERIRRLDFDFQVFNPTRRILSWIELHDHRILVWLSIAVMALGAIAALREFAGDAIRKTSKRKCKWCNTKIKDWEEHEVSPEHWRNSPK